MTTNPRTWLRRLYAAAICGLLVLPSALLIVPRFRTDDSAATENRTLAAFPSLKTEEGAWNPDYCTEFEAWFSDHFALRTEMVSAYSTLSQKIFRTSTEPDVILGKEGWLYYTPTVADITGTATCTETEISHMAHTLTMMSAYAEANGTKLVFAAAPDKGSIYPEYLPVRYLHTGGQNNLDLLHAALRETNVKVCDLRGTLREAAASQDRLLYHKLDTHWNGDGAMRGYEALMRTAGLDDLGFSTYPRTETQDFNGDLQTMLSPDKENPDCNAVYAVPQTYRHLGRFHSLDDLTIRTVCKEGSGSLMMFRDSFGRALIPLLSQRFQTAAYYRADCVPLADIETIRPDVVIYELVERNLSRLLTCPPIMPAPECEALPAPSQTADPAQFRLETETEGTYLHCCGLYDPTVNADAVYCAVGGKVYEAFPCCEAEMLGLETPSANGFSLRIPLEAVPDHAALTILLRKGDEIVCAGSAAL